MDGSHDTTVLNKLMYYHLKTRYCIVIIINDVTGKSHEHRLITKEHIAMHTNLILLFNPSKTEFFLNA